MWDNTVGLVVTLVLLIGWTPLTAHAQQPAKVPRIGYLLADLRSPCRSEPVVQAFRELGYEVFEAGNGPAALAILQQHPGIGLLFTDIGLPGGMTGRQLATEASRLRPEMHVLFTTGYTSNAIIHHGMLDPGVNFLGKPFSIVQLTAKLHGMGLPTTRHGG